MAQELHLATWKTDAKGIASQSFPDSENKLEQYGGNL